MVCFSMSLMLSEGHTLDNKFMLFSFPTSFIARRPQQEYDTIEVVAPVLCMHIRLGFVTQSRICSGSTV